MIEAVVGLGALRARWRARLYWAALAAGGFAWAMPAGAQVSPVVPTPAELAPRAPVTTDSRELPAVRTPPRRLAEPEQLELDVTGYTVADDAPVELRAALGRLTAPYVGPKKTYEDLVNAADDVTRFLNRELGLYLGYAYIPEQQPTDGRIRIEVLEGRLDQVILKWPSTPLPVSKEVIEGYLAALKPGAVLRVRDVERVVFLVNDLRGILARFDVQPGSQPGTASLVVTPREDSSKSAKLDVDVNGSRFLGKERLGGLWALNSPSGVGDALTVNGLASANGGLYFALAGYTRPVGSDGLKLGGSLSFIQYKLDATEFPLGVSGTAVNGTLYGLYPWVRARNLNVFMLGAYNHTDFTDRREVVGTTDRKQVDSLSVGATGDFRDDVLTGGVNSFEANLSGGQVKYPGTPPAGLDDAPNYRKLTLSFNRLQNVMTSRLLFYVAVRGQWAFDNLDTSEQFRLGGPDGIRAFSPGEGTGDSGWLATTELRLLPPEEWLGRIARESVVSLFFDTGRVTFRHDPSARPSGFVNTASFSGYGLAVSWVHGNDYALRLAIAKPRTGTPKADTLVRDPRLYAQFTKFF